MNETKQAVLNTLVAVGRVMRSKNVLFQLNGEDSKNVQVLIDDLETLCRRIASGELDVTSETDKQEEVKTEEADVGDNDSGAKNG